MRRYWRRSRRSWAPSLQAHTFHVISMVAGSKPQPCLVRQTRFWPEPVGYMSTLSATAAMMARRWSMVAFSHSERICPAGGRETSVRAAAIWSSAR
jgi:hypothetical protein